MRSYESVVIVDPGLTDAQVNDELNKLVEVLKANGGLNVKTQNWGKKELAYKVRNKKFGSHVAFEFTTENAGLVDEFQRVLRITDNILKFQTVVTSVRTRKYKGNPKRAGSGSSLDFDMDDRDSYY